EPSQELHRLVAYRQHRGVCDTRRRRRTLMKLICERTTFIPGFCVFLLHDKDPVCRPASARPVAQLPIVARNASLTREHDPCRRRVACLASAEIAVVAIHGGGSCMPSATHRGPMSFRSPAGPRRLVRCGGSAWTTVASARRRC